MRLRACFLFLNDPATTEIYTLSLHDALPISEGAWPRIFFRGIPATTTCRSPSARTIPGRAARSEEHTSELQSHVNLVCRLLLEKKKPSNLLRTSLTKLLASPEDSSKGLTYWP